MPLIFLKILLNRLFVKFLTFFWRENQGKRLVKYDFTVINEVNSDLVRAKWLRNFAQVSFEDYFWTLRDEHFYGILVRSATSFDFIHPLKCRDCEFTWALGHLQIKLPSSLLINWFSSRLRCGLHFWFYLILQICYLLR